MIENLDLHPWFRCFLSLLNQHQVDYLLVGGHAARFYGVQRLARDLDLWVPIDAANSAKIGKALEALTGEVAPQILEALSTPWRIVRLWLPPLTIEIVQPII